MKNIDAVLSVVSGWLDTQDAYLLASYAERVEPPNVIVEIGSFRGRSTCVIASVSHVPVYAVDPHAMSVGDSYQFGDKDRIEFAYNVSRFGLDAKVRPINLPSWETGVAWNQEQNPVGFLYVDGRHSYEGVRDDLDIWRYNMIKGGYIAFHDANASQIKQAILEKEWLEFVEGVNITEVYRVNDLALEFI